MSPFALDVTAELIWTPLMLRLYCSITPLVRMHPLSYLKDKKHCKFSKHATQILCTYCIWFKSKLHNIRNESSVTLQHYWIFFLCCRHWKWSGCILIPYVGFVTLVAASRCWAHSCSRSVENKVHIIDILRKIWVLLKECWQNDTGPPWNLNDHPYSIHYLITSILPSIFHSLPKKMHALPVLCRVLPAWHALTKILTTAGICLTTAVVQRGR